jgi:hypothetical protein
MTVSQLPRPAAITVPCPPWCVYGPHDYLSAVHISDGAEVPVTSLDHFCRTGEDECEAGGNVAQLVQDGSGTVAVELIHGEEGLPAMTLEAAAELALGILRLVAEASAELRAAAEAHAAELEAVLVALADAPAAGAEDIARARRSQLRLTPGGAA